MFEKTWTEKLLAARFFGGPASKTTGKVTSAADLAMKKLLHLRAFGNLEHGTGDALEPYPLICPKGTLRFNSDIAKPQAITENYLLDTATGEAYERAGGICMEGYIPVEQGVTYYMQTRSDANVGGTVRIFEYDSSKNYLQATITVDNSTFTVGSTTAYIRWHTGGAGTFRGQKIYNNAAALNAFYTKGGGHTVSITDIDSVVQTATVVSALTGGDDYEDVVTGEVVRKTAVVRLSETMPWQDEGGNTYSLVISDMDGSADYVYCNCYATAEAFGIWAISDVLYVHDAEAADLSAFKAALSTRTRAGHAPILVYPLAQAQKSTVTPATITIDADQSPYSIEAGGDTTDVLYIEAIYKPATTEEEGA